MMRSQQLANDNDPNNSKIQNQVPSHIFSSVEKLFFLNMCHNREENKLLFHADLNC